MQLHIRKIMANEFLGIRVTGVALFLSHNMLCKKIKYRCQEIWTTTDLRCTSPLYMASKFWWIRLRSILTETRLFCLLLFTFVVHLLDSCLCKTSFSKTSTAQPTLGIWWLNNLWPSTPYIRIGMRTFGQI